MRTHGGGGGGGMKDLSFFLLKNSLAAKMKKGIRSFCNGVGSTTTLDQRKAGRDTSCGVAAAPPSVAASSSFLDEGINYTVAAAGTPLTLEQMILQLDMEEEAARRAKLDDDPDNIILHHHHHRRMSCVHSSDILRSARNALNQYPRFSLDGRDAMYRSSFLNAGGRRSVRRPAGLRTGAASPSVEDQSYYGRRLGDDREPRRASTHGLPATVAGETVVWCKPGVVAQLMGLEAVPVPLGGRVQYCGKRRVVPAMGRKQSLRRVGRHELERERLAMGVHGRQFRGARRESVGSCSGGIIASSCCVAPPPVCARPSRGPPDWRLGGRAR